MRPAPFEGRSRDTYIRRLVVICPTRFILLSPDAPSASETPPLSRRSPTYLMTRGPLLPARTSGEGARISLTHAYEGSRLPGTRSKRSDDGALPCSRSYVSETDRMDSSENRTFPFFAIAISCNVSSEASRKRPRMNPTARLAGESFCVDKQAGEPTHAKPVGREGRQFSLEYWTPGRSSSIQKTQAVGGGRVRLREHFTVIYLTFNGVRLCAAAVFC